MFPAPTFYAIMFMKQCTSGLVGEVDDMGIESLFHLNRYSAGTKTERNSHDYAELLYVSDGSFTQHIKGEAIHMKRGDVCIVDNDCEHCESFGDESAFIIRIELSDEMINAVVSNTMADKQVVDYINELIKVLKTSGYIHFVYKDEHDNELKDMLTALISECGMSDIASVYICQGFLLRILWRLGTVYAYAQSRYIRKKINWLLHKEITDFIEDNMKDVTIDMLVERFGYQEDYFNRFLKAQTGMTFTEYLQDCRLKKSAILLIEASMDVDDIIKTVGYRNKGYFYKIFTEKYNMTPAKFRKYIKEKELSI